MRLSVTAGVVALASIAGVGLLSFQNCARMKAGAGFAAEQSQSDAVAPPAFKKGDAFDDSKLPVRTRMVQTLLSHYQMISGKYWALAVARNGFGGVVNATLTQAGANADALALCNVNSGLPCALVAVAGQFALDSSELDSSYVSMLKIPTEVGRGMNPLDNENTSASTYEDYRTWSTPKALVIGGSVGYYVSANSEPLASTAEAERIALESCELQSAVPPCFTLALDDKIVFGIGSLRRKPAIDYAARTIGPTIPTLTAASYGVQMAYLDATPANQFSAIANNAEGESDVRYGTSATDAETQALAACNADLGAGDPVCFIYALGRQVLFTPANLLGFADKDLFCGAAVRDSCASHAAIGCTEPGLYAVLVNGIPSEVSCNVP